ncbi:MAG: cobalt-precorrin 5A hydrolase [Clostridiaceae bacterium]|nr:cobalt-precorrin 5A hydrolase [Clostridiaceae bacterium]
MKLACIAFTSSGFKIAERIKASNFFEIDIFDKRSYKEKLNYIFSGYKYIVFISSAGIAIRLSAPYLLHKTVDPAIVVVDDLGRFSISLVSGHLGGANELTLKLSEILKCQPIITTASDGRGIEAIDMFAKANELYIESLEDAKKITAIMIEHKKIKLESEVKLQLGYDNISDIDYEAVVIVSSKQRVSQDMPCCILRPRNINIGIGCRRGKTKEDILEAIDQVFDRYNLSKKSIKAVATVDIKADETGIIEACKELGCSMRIFDRKSISKVERMFTSSNFVKSKIGVSSVCEPCAYLLGGSLIVPKTIVDGITIAVSKEE